MIIKRLIVIALERACALLDYLPYYDFKHREFSKNQLGCILGVSNLSARLDDRWKTNSWKPVK